MGQNQILSKQLFTLNQQKNIITEITCKNFYIYIWAFILYYHNSHSQEARFKSVYECKLYTAIINNIA